MAVIGLNHVNIRTLDVAASAKFYVDILDFELREGPIVTGNQSNWLYDKQGNAIIHFRVMEAGSTSTGPIDHVALNCQNKRLVVERLKAHNVQFSVAENLTPGVTQIFLKDPHGVPLELNFCGE